MRSAFAHVRSRPRLPPAVLLIAAAISVLGGIGENSLIALWAAAVLITGSALLWRPGESPILLLIFGFQWIQATISILHADWYGVAVSDLSAFGGDLALAIYLSLLGLLVLAVGMRVGAGHWRAECGALALNVAKRFRTSQWFRLYLAAWFVSLIAKYFTVVVPGLAQAFLALASLKWAFFFMLIYATFAVAGAKRIYWILAFGFEFLLSLGGFFSDFKTVFLFTICAMVAARVRPSLKQYIGLSVLAVALLGLGVTWSAVKKDYRTFVNLGEGSQVVKVDYASRMTKLAGLVAELDSQRLAFATEIFAKRMAYVEFFGVVLQTVPNYLPHEGGAIWLDAIVRPFTPRLLFPEKAVINDTERTRYYTGRRTGLDMSESGGTSISIGYIGESYIDFGKFGMMLAIFAYGILMGWIYRWMLTNPRSRGLLGMGLATATLFGALDIGSSITKVFGGMILMLLASFVIIRLIAPRYLPGLRA